MALTAIKAMRQRDLFKHAKKQRSRLVPLKQIPRVHLVRHVRELVAPAVGDDYVAAGLEAVSYTHLTLPTILLV